MLRNGVRGRLRAVSEIPPVAERRPLGIEGVAARELNGQRTGSIGLVGRRHGHGPLVRVDRISDLHHLHAPANVIEAALGGMRGEGDDFAAVGKKSWTATGLLSASKTK